MQPTLEAILEAAMALSPEQRSQLTDQLLESLPASRRVFSDELRAELDRRWSDYLANPDDVVSLEDVKSAVLARLSQ